MRGPEQPCRPTVRRRLSPRTERQWPSAATHRAIVAGSPATNPSACSPAGQSRTAGPSGSPRETVRGSLSTSGMAVMCGECDVANHALPDWAKPSSTCRMSAFARWNSTSRHSMKSARGSGSRQISSTRNRVSGQRACNAAIIAGTMSAPVYSIPAKSTFDIQLKSPHGASSSEPHPRARSKAGKVARSSTV